MPSKKDFERLSEEVHELFEEVWRMPRLSGLRRGFRPQVDCFHTDGPHELTVIVELAGVDPDMLKIDATEHHLRIWGERQRPRVDGQVFQQMEIEYGPFERHIALSEPVDPAHARASYERGLLTIVLPIGKQVAEPVKVPIEVKAKR